MLRPVIELAARANDVVERCAAELAEFDPELEVHHIGATAMPFGHTKGDVDVNVRVAPEKFRAVVAFL